LAGLSGMAVSKNTGGALKAGNPHYPCSSGIRSSLADV
jgi:hypothetical protein